MKFSRYTVSDDGHIYDNQKQCYVKEFKSNNYLQCQVYDDDSHPHVFGVHQVVARLCCKDWFEGCSVHHIDGNYHNNSPSNLKCYSRSEHARKHAVESDIGQRLGNYVKQNGPPNKGKKMSDEFRKHCSESAKRRIYKHKNTV